MAIRPVSTGAPGDPAEPAIYVTGRQWWWDIQYRYSAPSQNFSTAGEVHVPVGKTVRILVTSNDVIHSFWIPQLHPKIDAIPNRTNELSVRADVAGTYRGECAEYCGEQHAHMALVVVAEPPDQYAEWLAQQQRSASAPADPAAVQGNRSSRGAAAPSVTRCAGHRPRDGWALISPTLRAGRCLRAVR